MEKRVHSTEKNPLEAVNLCFNGTLVVSGEGYGIVIWTGDCTVLGQIADMTVSQPRGFSPLSTEIQRFYKLITIVAITTALLFFIFSILAFKNLNNSLLFAIGVLVAWVPQGFPATVTLLLSIAAQRMATHQVLVKNLLCVENLGSITLMATDKTGTVTRNQMTVTRIWTNARELSHHGPALESNSEDSIKMDASGIIEIVMMSAMCTRARFDRLDVPIEERKVIGNPTEAALLRFAGSFVHNIDYIGDKLPKVFEIPFNSTSQWHLTIHTRPHERVIFTLYIKGSTEKVLSLCSAIQFNGSDCPLTTKLKEDVMNACEKMAGQGQRVLAFAQLALNSEVYPENYVFQKYPENYPSGGYSFVGIVGLEDPPKHGVREAIGTCRRAGIKVVMVMVTGDHPLTAESIGRRINLMIGETREGMAKRLGTPVEDIPESHVSSVVIQRNKVAQLTDEEWVTVFQNDEIIFARTSPRDKLMIVKRAQALGHIVGVRGDGVNDAPALQNADLGISMNQSGSDVSKESASMILLDDNFASIVKGIKEGRLIYNNLKKSIQYTLSHIIPEVLPYLLYAMVPIPLAVTAIEMLVIDLGFELMAAVSFAWEPSEGHEDRLMRMPPRRIVTPESIARTHRKQNERQNAVIEPVPDFGSSTEDQDSNFELPSKWRRYHYEIKRMRTQEFWTDLISSSQQEDRLVDKEVLSWSYLEAGVIEALGALTTFFVVLDSWGISISTAIVAQRAGSYFPPQSSPLYLPDGTSINGKDQFEALRQAQSS